MQGPGGQLLEEGLGGLQREGPHRAGRGEKGMEGHRREKNTLEVTKRGLNRRVEEEKPISRVNGRKHLHGGHETRQ